MEKGSQQGFHHAGYHGGRFDARNGGAILGKDKLPISCKASLVYRLDPSRVKEFMEDYGGIAQSSGRNDDEVADEIMLFAYKKFHSAAFPHSRAGGLSQYNALDASGSLQKISDNVYTQLSKRLDGTPFIVDSVAVETNPRRPSLNPSSEKFRRLRKTNARKRNFKSPGKTSPSSAHAVRRKAP
ncbi:MAG: hypothetical protein ACLT38_11390 [Akkermansia sp.]